MAVAIDNVLNFGDAIEAQQHLADERDLSKMLLDREHILRILGETNWIVGGPNGAAARLGMKRTTLQARMRKLNIARKSN